MSKNGKVGILRDLRYSTHPLKAEILMKNSGSNVRYYDASGIGISIRICLLAVGFFALIALSGCKNPTEHRQLADETAYEIIAQSQQEALGKIEDVSIMQPSDIFRRRIIESQGLLYSDSASLGRDKLKKIDHWPDDKYFDPIPDPDALILELLGADVELSLINALMIGAQNNPDYQSYKEAIFSEALNLDLERNEFRSIFSQALKNSFIRDAREKETVRSVTNSSERTAAKKLKGGAELTAQLAVDLANLVSLGGASVIGLSADASVSIPLMRGSGKHIVTENLTQAQRNVIYSIYEFERFKRTFAVKVADEYLGVLQQLDQLDNNEQNYKGLVISVRRATQKANEGQFSEIEVGQAVQSELRARDRWIKSIQNAKQTLDEFKILLGIPTDARIKLDRQELKSLTELADQWILDQQQKQQDARSQEILAADDPVVLTPPGIPKPGPLEIDDNLATMIAFDNRLDLRVAQGTVYDQQRFVIVKADRLRGELTLLGTAQTGERKTASEANGDNSRIEFNHAQLSSLITLNLPIERTAERNEYRNSLIDLEKTIRQLQSLEDNIKLQVRNQLRALLSARESVLIQFKSVEVAEERVNSANMFLDYGRAQIRDLLEAQEAQLDAKNAFTAAIKKYRIAELQIQRDMGLLEVNEKGLFKEIDPEVLKNAGKN